MERIVNPVKGNLDVNNIMRVWKDYTTKDAIVIVKKTCKNHKAWNNKFLWRKLFPDVVHDFSGFMTELIKESMKETVDVAKKDRVVAVKGFRIWILEKFKS